MPLFTPCPRRILWTRTFSVTLAVLGYTGCAPSSPARRPFSPPDNRLASIVLTEEHLLSSGTLLAAMTGRVPSMRVTRSSDCPALTLRNARIPKDDTAPLVYVDGTRTEGTCTLVDLSPRDVERVEVYPAGVTMRPGYARDSNGLILIFMKSR